MHTLNKPNAQPPSVENSQQLAVSIDSLVKEFKPSRAFAAKHPERLNSRGYISAVNGLSFAASRGQVTVLLGSNGAGKTTTLACAQGLQKPTSGLVRLLGENPWGASSELRARVGIMLQDGGLPQAMHPVPLLKHIAQMYKIPLPVNDLIERLGIDSFNGTTIRRLSGGQKQRVALAAALIGQPDVLFLDEPSAGLDPQSRQVVFDIIREQKESGVAIILTTHLLDDAQKLADTVYIVNEGSVVRHGSVQELLATPSAQRQVLHFSLEQPLTDQLHLSRRFASNITLKKIDATSYSLEGQLSPTVLAQLMQELADANVMPISLNLSPRTLEDVFLEISGRELT